MFICVSGHSGYRITEKMDGGGSKYRKFRNYIVMQIRWSKTWNFAWEPDFLDSAYSNYDKKSGSQLLPQNAPRRQIFGKWNQTICVFLFSGAVLFFVLFLGNTVKIQTKFSGHHYYPYDQCISHILFVNEVRSVNIKSLMPLRGVIFFYVHAFQYINVHM